MTSNRTILITGVTGNQGGRGRAGAARRRIPSTAAGRARRKASGTTLAREAGVGHYVYTSVGSAHTRTGVPHFDNKWRIEETVRGLRFPSHVIPRPVFFMENLLAPFSLQGSTLAWALGPGTKLQMIAVDDIGWFGARALTDAVALRREIDLAGGVLTMPAAAEILTEALGQPIAFVQTPIEQVRQYSKDMALMLEWFERVGYSADIARLEREFGRALTKLHDWARRHGRPNGLIDLPWIPGHDFSGVVEQIGTDVATFASGDALFGTTTGMGAYAEYLAVKATAIARKPFNLSFEEAASVPVASQTAWHRLFTHGHMEKGQTILIHGGAGAAGAYAVQLASDAGATVIASGDDEAYLKSIGASRVINYREAQFEKVLREKVDQAPCVGRDDEARTVRGPARQNRATSGRGDDTTDVATVPASRCGSGLEGHRREPARGSWDVAQWAWRGKTEVTWHDRASCGLL